MRVTVLILSRLPSGVSHCRRVSTGEFIRPPRLFSPKRSSNELNSRNLRLIRTHSPGLVPQVPMLKLRTKNGQWYEYACEGKRVSGLKDRRESASEESDRQCG